ncbi:hypothetical protein ACRALDRAFT_209395 [Sodiomyces alcalophilus JCM 7366]|uniref:uncharacterized protein n=1 Tax=Sodiomyces alcalophilus JCM 7366 TaxID=591952 RepID=UPI0039B5E056
MVHLNFPDDGDGCFGFGLLETKLLMSLYGMGMGMELKRFAGLGGNAIGQNINCFFSWAALSFR